MVVEGSDRPPLGSFRGEPQSARVPPPTNSTPPSSHPANNVARAPISQRGRPRGAASSQQQQRRGVMSFVENAFSPFVRCWQPPLASCHNGTYAACGADNRSPACRARACSPTPMGIGPVTPHTPPQRNASMQYQPSPVSSSSPSIHYPPSPHYPHQQSPLGEYHQSPLQRQQQPVKDIEHPHENDVLCGRGGGSNRHNCSFRELVAANKASYAILTKKQKMLMARRIVELVNNTDPPGRFLARDTTTCRWYDIGLPRSLEKTSQALREKGSSNEDENTADAEMIESENVNPKPPKPSPRSVEAPVINIPPHLESIYRSTPRRQPASPSLPAWPIGMSHHRSSPTYHREPPYTPNLHGSPYRQQRRYPGSSGSTSGVEVDDLPAPHRGSFPFHARHTPRQEVPFSFRARSNPSSTMSHSASSPTESHRPRTKYTYHHTPPSPVYSQASSVDFEIDPHNNSILACAPSDHLQEYSSSIPSDKRYQHNTSFASTHFPTTQDSPNMNALHNSSGPHEYDEPRWGAVETAGQPREGKRQRTNFDSIFSQEGEEHLGIERTLSEDHRSQQLSFAVESKLTLQEKVIGRPRDNDIIASPSGMLQSRHEARTRGGGTSSNNTSMNDSLNISADSTDGLTGLAALSTAAFLRLDGAD